MADTIDKETGTDYYSKALDFLIKAIDSGGIEVGEPKPNGGFAKSISNTVTKDLAALLLREREKGEAVGEYRVADNLYSLTTHIYLFGSQEKPEQLKIANESATEIVQICEKYLNKNAKTYRNAMREQELSRLSGEESHE